MNFKINDQIMVDAKMILDITPSVTLPTVSWMATGSQVVSLIAAVMGIVYTAMRMYSWFEERKKLKNGSKDSEN